MSDLLTQYKEYYKVRKERYEDNPNYPNTYQTENAMYEAMNSCAELGEFKEKLGNLNEQNAVNLTIDEYTMRKKYFDELGEPVRVLAANRILEKCKSLSTTQEVITVAQEEENKNSIEISMDESVRYFISDEWKYMDDIEIYSNAEVPSSYKSSMQRRVETAVNRIKESKNHLEKNNRDWDPNWSYHPEENLNPHHFRLVPYSKQHLEEKLEQYKRII
ncbi:MAG: hypothetical protein KDC84_05450 [Crocinitomicaceae bacterium]|nr:hypothetical protein [Crocinitomicaceae bacterium]